TIQILHTLKHVEDFHLCGICLLFPLKAFLYALLISFLQPENTRLIFYTNSWIYSSIFSVVLFSITKTRHFVNSVLNKPISIVPKQMKSIQNPKQKNRT